MVGRPEPGPRASDPPRALANHPARVSRILRRLWWAGPIAVPEADYADGDPARSDPRMKGLGLELG